MEGQMLSTLGKPELQAIEMKYEGFNYKEIAEATETEYKTVRVWFSRGGKLYEFYKAYAEEETKLRRAQTHDTFKAHLNNAVRVLVHVMNKSKLDVARVQAAKEIINRQLGEPLKVVAVDDGKVNHILEAIKQLDAETIQPNEGGGDSTDSSQS